MNDQEYLVRILDNQAKASQDQATLTQEVKDMKGDVSKLVHYMDGNNGNPGIRMTVARHGEEIKSLKTSNEKMKDQRNNRRLWWDRTILATLFTLVLAEIVPFVREVMQITGKS